MSCSSAASALAFDAGGTARQEDIWVGGLTEDEAKQVVELHGREGEWGNIKAIAKKCAFSACLPEFRRLPRRGCGERL